MGVRVKAGEQVVRFVVEGEPRPEGSKVALLNRHTGRPFVKDSNPKGLERWRADIAAEARAAVRDAGLDSLLVGPLWVRLDFRFVRPQSHKGRTWPCLKNQGADVDKLVRAAFDAMSRVVFEDDAQVVLVTATKDYAERPGVVVKVGRVDD